jgi:hypothetical protein
MHLQKALDVRDAVPMNCSTRAIHELSGFFCNFLSPCHETGGSCKDPPKSATLLGILKTFKIFTWIVLSRNNKRNRSTLIFFRVLRAAGNSPGVFVEVSTVELSKGVTATGFPHGGTVWDEVRVTQDLDIRQ